MLFLVFHKLFFLCSNSYLNLILYESQAFQNQYEELTRTLESTSYVSHSEYTTSWLRTFLSVADQFRAMNNSLDTEDEFVSLLRKEVSEYLNDFYYFRIRNHD